MKITPFNVMDRAAHALRALSNSGEDAIDLSGLALRALPVDLFSVQHLRRINLSKNELDSLPDMFDKFPKLSILGLLKNQLTTLPPSILAHTGLTELYCGGNRLKSVTLPDFDSIGAWRNMKKLSFARNFLTTFPSSLCDLESMEKLYAYGNKICEIPRDISQLTSLSVLYLNENEISHVPDELCDLKKLKQLFLGSNRIKALPDRIGEMQLDSLHIEHNLLTDLPDSISHMTTLTTLDVSSNRITAALKFGSQIGGLPKLKTVLCNDNHFMTSLPKNIVETTGESISIVVVGLNGAKVGSMVDAHVFLLAGLKPITTSMGLQTDTIQARITGPSDIWVQNVSTDIVLSDGQDFDVDHHVVSFSPEVPGEHSLQLNVMGISIGVTRNAMSALVGSFGVSRTMNKYASTSNLSDVRGRQQKQFVFSVAGGLPQPTSCTAYGDGLSYGFVGMPSTFRVHARNKISTDEPPYTIDVTPPATTSVTVFKGMMQEGHEALTQAWLPDGDVEVMYTPITPGFHYMSIMLEGSPITEGSKKIAVLPAAQFPLRAIKHGKNVHASHTSKIETGDYFGQSIVVKQFVGLDFDRAASTDRVGSRVIGVLREIAAAAGIAPHPGIITVMGCVLDVTKKLCCLITERAGKGALSDGLTTFTRGNLLPCLVDIGNAVEYLHAHQPYPIAHGNICSNNVVLTNDLRGKLIDFGHTRIVLPHETASLVKDVQSFGTLCWEVLMMEQSMGRDIDTLKAKMTQSGRMPELMSVITLAWSGRTSMSQVLHGLKQLVSAQKDFLPTVSPADRARDTSPRPMEPESLPGAVPMISIDDADEGDEELMDPRRVIPGGMSGQVSMYRKMRRWQSMGTGLKAGRGR